MKPTTFSGPEVYNSNKNELFFAPRISAEELLCELQNKGGCDSKILVNIEEKCDSFIIELAAPGLHNYDFNVSIDDHVLTVICLQRGGGDEKKIYRQKEFDFHCFKKEILLPPNTDTYFINAVYDDGIFRAVLPKSRKPISYRTEAIVVY